MASAFNLDKAISIHSPRMGRDAAAEVLKTYLEGFQSTLPAWGETGGYRREVPRVFYFNPLSPHGERPRRRAQKEAVADISIHSPRMGRDFKEIATISGATNFNPLSPHGERRRWWTGRPLWSTSFQSTLPAWGETAFLLFQRAPKTISIHSPRMGRDKG